MPKGGLGRVKNPLPVSVTTIAPPTAILHGQVTLIGAAQQFPAGACKSVTIESVAGNAIVGIGDDNTVTLLTGYILRAPPAGGGQATVSFDIDNLNRIWIIGTVGQIITYIGVN